MTSEKRQKVLVGMSGGVDSSVAAALLLEQGYDVIGAYMKNWSGDVSGPSCVDKENVGKMFEECGWREDRRDAMRVASQLGIPFVTLDFEKEYREKVVEDMFREFQAGRTPNPDVLCNKFIKFDLFVKAADELGCQFVATGHYARTFPNLSLRASQSCEAGRLAKQSHGKIASVAPLPRNDSWGIFAGSDPNKDQTYFLWAIPPTVLPRVLFPVGGMLKSEVRKKARDLKLATAEKEESMGICFIGEVKIPAFLKARIPEDPGEIVTTEGKMVGTHEGVAFYTIGQRHGLNVGGGEPYYVVGKDPEKRRLIVSSQFHPALYQKELTAASCNWFRHPSQSLGIAFPWPGLVARPPERPNAFGRAGLGGKATPTGLASKNDASGSGVAFRCSARIRYRQPLAKCTVEFLPLPKGEEEGVAGERVHVVFDEPQRAVTPGQSIVFYDGEPFDSAQGKEMLGGGIIQ